MAKNEFKETQKIAKEAVSLKKDKKYNEAEKKLREGLDKYPDNNYLKASLADLYYRKNEFDQALKLADEILSEKPYDNRALTVKGNVYFARRDFERARDFFEEVYYEQKNSYNAFRLIKTLIKLKEYDRALELAGKWEDKEGDNSRFKKLSASIYEKMGNKDRAEKFYDDYLKDKPEDQFAYKEKLKVRLENKAPQEAVDELKKILRVGNRDKNPHLHSLLAEKLEKTGDYKEALKEYKKTLELDPENRFALKQAGFILHKQEEYRKALSYLKEAFRGDPSDYYIRSVLMNIFKELGCESEGIEFFREVIRDNPGFNNLWGMIKKLSSRMGDNDNDRQKDQ